MTLLFSVRRGPAGTTWTCPSKALSTSAARESSAPRTDGIGRVDALQKLQGGLIYPRCKIAVERNLTQEEWRTYVGDEDFRATCENLPFPEE